MTDSNPLPLDDNEFTNFGPILNTSIQPTFDENGNALSRTPFHGCEEADDLRNTTNKKAKALEKGAKRVSKILHKRSKVVAKTEAYINRASMGLMTMGMCFTTVGEIFGAPLLAVGAGLYTLNKHLGGKGQRKIEHGLNALSICTDPDATKDKKREAFDHLIQTKHHIRYWEKTRSIGATILKFGLGELHLLVSGAQAVGELVKSSDTQQHKDDVKPSKSLHGALSLLRHGLDLPKRERTHKAQSFNATPE